MALLRPMQRFGLDYYSSGQKKTLVCEKPWAYYVAEIEKRHFPGLTGKTFPSFF